MATKVICDRCGETINPTSSKTVVGYGKCEWSPDEHFDLCVSCAMKLKTFLEGKENK